MDHAIFLLRTTRFGLSLQTTQSLLSDSQQSFPVRTNRHIICSAVKNDVTTSSFAIILATEQIFQIIQLETVSIPVLSINEELYESAYSSSLLLFLLQSFFTDFASLGTTVSTLYQLFNRSTDVLEASSYASSGRKIRPRDVDFTTLQNPKEQPVVQTTPTINRSLALLSSLANKNPEVYQILVSTVTLLLKEQGKATITPEYCNQIIRANYTSLEESIQSMYNQIKSVATNPGSSDITVAMLREEDIVSLKVKTENLILSESLQEIRKRVLETLTQSFSQPGFHRRILNRSFIHRNFSTLSPFRVPVDCL